MSQILPEPIQFGRYTLYERIGRGGMADVFKARIQGPAGFERVFVIKRILPQLSDDPTFIKMLIQEAKLSARLIHANIVQIFELGAVDGEYFISMEHVPGHDLAETTRAMWKHFGAPRPELVAFIGREMCRGLAYAHDLLAEDGRPQGMIHRDVSPPNVMLAYEGAVKLVDFGIAKALGEAPETTKNGTLKGKYAYMAPEQTVGEDVDHRIDIFSTAIVMHEVLTGRRLFKGANDVQTVERVRQCEVRPPSEFNPLCPRALDEIVLRALSRDRERRFPSAGEMADALDDVVHAARFMPQHLASTLRTIYAGEIGTSGSVTDRRLISSSSSIPVASSTHSPSHSHSAQRSPTIPPVFVSASENKSTSQLMTRIEQAARDEARHGRSRVWWKRRASWAVTAVCAGLVGVAIVASAGSKKGGSVAPPIAASGAVNPPPMTLPTSQVMPPGAPTSAPPRADGPGKPVPVLIRTDPAGAEVFVAGEEASRGATPLRIDLLIDKANPPRVTLRKPGYDDQTVTATSEDLAAISLSPSAAGAAAAARSGVTARAAVAARAAMDRPVAARTGKAGGASTRGARARMKRSDDSGQTKSGRSEIVDPFLIDPVLVNPF